MMSQIHCKQSIRIEKSGWFKHYFPGNLRRNILFKVCNYTSYQNLQKTSLPNPFAREKAGDKAGTVSFLFSIFIYFSGLFYSYRLFTVNLWHHNPACIIFLKVLFQMFYLEQNEERLRLGVCSSFEG